MQEKRKPNFYTGQVIYIKNDNDLIKQLINGQHGLYASSHQKIYGTPIKTAYVNQNVQKVPSSKSIGKEPELEIIAERSNNDVLRVPILRT